MSNTTQLPADVRERVLTMLTAMEWTALVEHHDGRWYACCPWCGGENPDDDETPPGRAGHAERCELAAVIALLRTPRGEGEAEAESGGDVTVSQLLAVLDEYNAEVFCMTPENADGTPMFSVAIARGESAERLKQWANEDAEESAALRSEAQGEERASKYGALLAFADAISDAVWGGERAWEQDGGLERLSQKVRRWAKERAALRSEAPVEGEVRERVAPGWSEVRERANMLRAVLRENGFEHLRSALVGQHSDAVFYGQWERHKALLRDLLDALDAALRSEAQGEEDAVRRTWELAVQRAYGCLDYCGGYRGAELKAFHSGIKTVIRALESGLDTVDTQTAALDRIGAALRSESDAD